MSILKKYESYPFVKIYSEPDFGIYNAMNRGIARATGDFIYFLNAGDVLYDANVLENVAGYIKDRGTIYYGKIYAVYEQGRKELLDYEKEEGTLEEKLRRGHMPCHQSIFASRELLSGHYFNEEYKIRADYEWLVHCVCKGVVCYSMPYIVCNYDKSGISESFANKNQLNKETQKIIGEHAFGLNGKEDAKKEYTSLAFRWKEMADKNYCIIRLLSRILEIKQKGMSLENFFQKNGYKRIAIYGMGFLGQRLYDEFMDSSIEMVGAIDRNSNIKLDKCQIYQSVHEMKEEPDVVVVTAITYYNEIKEEIQKESSVLVISMEDVINQMEI